MSDEEPKFFTMEMRFPIEAVDVFLDAMDVAAGYCRNVAKHYPEELRVHYYAAAVCFSSSHAEVDRLKAEEADVQTSGHEGPDGETQPE